MEREGGNHEACEGGMKEERKEGGMSRGNEGGRKQKKHREEN